MHEFKTAQQLKEQINCPRCHRDNWQTSYLYCHDCRSEIQRSRIERERAEQSFDAQAKLETILLSSESDYDAASLNGLAHDKALALDNFAEETDRIAWQIRQTLSEVRDVTLAIVPLIEQDKIRVKKTLCGFWMIYNKTGHFLGGGRNLLRVLQLVASRKEAPLRNWDTSHRVNCNERDLWNLNN